MAVTENDSIEKKPADPSGGLVAADGTPLKQRLAQALFRSRLRAFVLVSPLLLFILCVFVIPIMIFMTRGFYDDTYESFMPESTPLLTEWDGRELPDEAVFAAVAADLKAAREHPDKPVGKVATRVNRELSGTRSLITKTARRARKMEAPFKEAMIDADKDWEQLETWQAMKVAATSLTPAYYAAALDMQYTATGELIAQDELRRIYIRLFLRTLEIALVVTLATLILGYPVAYLLSTLPNRISNLLLILVLLPFWTSILVRTTAWIAVLQGQGVLNDLAVFIGLVDDDNRLSLIYNKTGTLIAMTHILLPFMILPLYSVMKTVPPSYVRAAKSLGATNWTAFWRVYFPQTIPGIGAGGLLVFILAIGYYITPALVGGQDGVMISNFIDNHMRSTLNWSLAAALGGVLLVFVLFLYWLYDKIVGIDNMKLG
ncbi:ABC transporter permease [Rhodobacteraceae bacterium NNCM2]|nr:ABC transporter permease [Coraliihabitans acroporae]